jgi:NADH:ubiquinone reductase (non-electrogenic)
MFSKQLIDYTEKTFREETITIRTKTMVKSVNDKYIECETVAPDGTKHLEQIPYGLLVWATGNALRPVVKDLMSQIPAQKDARRGLSVNEYLVVKGTENIWAVGDCAVANYAPTAQVASQEGAFLARLLNQMAKTQDLQGELLQLSEAQEKAPNKEARDIVFGEIKELQKRLRRIKNVGPFEYSHQGSLAYIGSEKAVADISWLSGNVATGGTLTYLFWRSAYLSMCFSSKFAHEISTDSAFSECPFRECPNLVWNWFADLPISAARNRILVVNDWVKSKLFGRDVSRE